MRGVVRTRVWTLGFAAALTAALAVDGSGGAGGTDRVVVAEHDHLFAPVAAVAPVPLPRTGWTVTVDSQETARENGAATNVLDGNPATIWHTRYGAALDPLPHTLTIDMKAANTVTGLRYLPRPGTGSPNGRIGQYRLELSLDGTAWGAPAATGTLADDAAEKTVPTAATRARYVRLTALTEAGNRGPWTSAAEVNVLGSNDPRLPRTGWTATVDSQEAARENGAGANVLDGNPATIWHSRWSGPADPLPHAVTIDTGAAQTVAGLQYMPRQTSTRNGDIGQYEVELSGDGSTWGTPVATGTFASDLGEKTVTFPASTARYVRLTALTEAGNRGPWTSAAEINLLGSAAAPTASTGRWSAPVSFPLVPVAAATLPNGKILTWSAYLVDNFGGSNGRTQTAIYDPATGVVTQRLVSETGHDMFCPGIAVLPDGSVLVNGGSNSDKTSIYDPATGTWRAGGAMIVPRGYNATVTLSDGRVFTIGGSWSGAQGGKDGEVWSPAEGWKKLPGALVAPMLTADAQGVYRADNHGWLFAWSGGKVFQAGPSRGMNWYGTAGTGSVTAAGTRADDTDAMNGNAVMYDAGRILTIGGSPSYQNSDATKNAYVVDITGATVTTRKVASMSYARAFHNSVVLPDGKVLVIGGEAYPVPFSDNTSVLTPELWDPATGTFTAMAPMTVPRTYHSVALLQPDGRVIAAGGGLCGGCGTNHPNAEIFTPPYLLNPDGTDRPRPAITAAPATAAVGGTVAVTTSRAVTAFSLVRMGSATHSVDTDQRRIPVTATTTGTNAYRLALPADPGVLVPGQYLLFALDAAGVPSVAKVLRVS